MYSVAIENLTLKRKFYICEYFELLVIEHNDLFFFFLKETHCIWQESHKVDFQVLL